MDTGSAFLVSGDFWRHCAGCSVLCDLNAAAVGARAGGGALQGG